MFMNFFLVIYAYITLFYAFKLANWQKHNLFVFLKRFIIIYFLFMVVPFWDIALGYFYMKYLNIIQAGEKIYKPINVDGYLIESKSFLGTPKSIYGCGYCNFDKYQFLEMNLTRPGPLADTSGYHRFYLAEANDPKCELYYKALNSREEPFMYKREGYCVASEKMTEDKLISRYAYEYHAYQRLFNPFFLHIKESKSTIVERKTQKTVAQLKTYHFVPWTFMLDGTNHPSPRVFATLYDKYSLGESSKMHDIFPDKVLNTSTQQCKGKCDDPTD